MTCWADTKTVMCHSPEHPSPPIAGTVVAVPVQTNGTVMSVRLSKVVAGAARSVGHRHWQ